jgi:carbon monoxide dehydrogenase subunit G
MKVELERTFPMPATTDAAWAFLQNIEGVAGCMPGAKITERIDDTHYKGTISVRVGPAGMSFKGEIEVEALDAATHTLHLIGKGSDTSGTSGASMDLVARIEPGATEGTSNLVGRSEVTVSGKAAAFGGRMMGSVADQILKQFAGNFAAQLQSRAAAEAANAAAAGASTTAPPMAEAAYATAAGANATAPPSAAGIATAVPVTAASVHRTAGAQTASPRPFTTTSAAGANTKASADPPAVAPGTATPLAATTAGARTAGPGPFATTSAAGTNTEASADAPAMAASTALPPAATPRSISAATSAHAHATAAGPVPTSTSAPANELNVLALFWAILRDWFRGLFRRKPA